MRRRCRQRQVGEIRLLRYVATREMLSLHLQQHPPSACGQQVHSDCAQRLDLEETHPLPMRIRRTRRSRQSKRKKRSSCTSYDAVLMLWSREWNSLLMLRRNRCRCEAFSTSKIVRRSNTPKTSLHVPRSSRGRRFGLLLTPSTCRIRDVVTLLRFYCSLLQYQEVHY